MSTAAADRLTRLLALVPWLRARPGVTVGQAAEHFGVTSAQLEADLWLLVVNELPGQSPGELIDIQFWRDDDSVDASTRIEVIDPQTLGRPMRLRPDEAVSLLVGLRLLRELPGPVDRTVIDAVTAKIEAVAGEAAAASDRVVIEMPTDDGPVTQAVDQALATGRRLRLAYLVPSRDEVTERDVDPLRVLVVEGRVYLEAWCHLAEDLRTFRLDRVLRAEVLDAAVAAPAPAPDRQGTGLFTPGPGDVEVTVALTPAGRWIADYAQVDSITEEPDGGLVVRLRAADTRWIRRLLLTAGGSARVVAPEQVRLALEADATEALAAYDG